MKITKEVWSLGLLEQIKEFNSISDAVEDAAQNSAELSEMFARFMECMYGDYYRNKAQAVNHILGPGYEVEE